MAVVRLVGAGDDIEHGRASPDWSIIWLGIYEISGVRFSGAARLGVSRLPIRRGLKALSGLVLRLVIRTLVHLTTTSRSSLVRISQPVSPTAMDSLVPITNCLGIRQANGVWNVMPTASSKSLVSER